MVSNKTYADHIRERTRQREKALFIGEISRVLGKESDDVSEGNIEVYVVDGSGEHEMGPIPFVADQHAGHVSVPQVGESCAVDYTKGKGRTPVAVGVTSDDRDGYRSPNAREGHWRHEWTSRPDTSGDNVYLEAEPADHSAGAPELVRMAIKPDGLSDPTTEVTVDNSGSEPEITLSTDGTVTVDCDTIELGSGSLASVLNENAQIQYVGGGDNSSTRTANIVDAGTDHVDAS